MRQGSADDGQDLLALGSGEGKAGFANPFFTEAGLLTEEFDVLHKMEVRIELHKRLGPAIELAGLVPPPFAGEIPEFLILFRKSDPAARDPSVYPENGALEHEIVNSGEELVAIADEVQ